MFPNAIRSRTMLALLLVLLPAPPIQPGAQMFPLDMVAEQQDEDDVEDDDQHRDPHQGPDASSGRVAPRVALLVHGRLLHRLLVELLVAPRDLLRLLSSLLSSLVLLPRLHGCLLAHDWCASVCCVAQVSRVAGWWTRSLMLLRSGLRRRTCPQAVHPPHRAGRQWRSCYTPCLYCSRNECHRKRSRSHFPPFLLTSCSRFSWHMFGASSRCCHDPSTCPSSPLARMAGAGGAPWKQQPSPQQEDEAVDMTFKEPGKATTKT